MSQKKTVVISDIHMGTDASTNWYRTKIHESYLTSILIWILNNKDREGIEELVILGDLFDFWTCPPNEKPPTATDIINVNNKILGQNGLLSKVLTALNGNVTYLRGNHDITTTENDINQIGNQGQNIKFFPKDIYIKDRVIYTHGHLFTMFNAPPSISDPKSKEKVPIGHFVTRAISYYLQDLEKKKDKKEGEGIASEMPGFGVPEMKPGEGFLKTMVEIMAHIANKDWEKIRGYPVSTILLNTIQASTGIPDDYPIKLKDSIEQTNFAQVKVKYAGLWSDWCDQMSAGEEGRGSLFAYKAAWADYDGSYLGWFAQQLAFQHNADLVVMGHTHIPKLGLEGDRANYLNCGFECVPTPDMEKDKMTFGVVTTENGKAVPSVYYATANGEVGVLNPPPPKAELLGEIAMDYSCYITVENKSSEDYEIVPGTVNSEYGYFVVLPPEKIASNSTVKFWIQDFLGTEGSQGEVIYQGKKSGQKVPLTFRCTTVNVPGVNPNPNMCEGTNEFYTKSGSDNWGGKNQIAQQGSPFSVKFILHENNGNDFRQEGKSLIANNDQVLKVGELVSVNGNTDLSKIITGSDKAKIDWIKLEKASGIKGKLYSHSVKVYGRGPKGILCLKRPQPYARGFGRRCTAFFASQFYFFDGCFLEENSVFL
jgi:UDP-2,3-diacylglucosamine pyrophosphatase LpxH